MQPNDGSDGAIAERRPIPRRSHVKSKTGCRTCKARKVKCDEHRPLCNNCRRHFANLLECDFDDKEPIVDLNPTTSAAKTLPDRRKATVTSTGSSSRRTRSRRTISSTNNETQHSTVGREAEPLYFSQSVGTGLLDPFEARPESIESSDIVDKLMQHYLSDFAYRSFPFYATKPLISIWWPFVRSDEVLFNATLLISSLDRERLQNGKHRDRGHNVRLLGRCLSLLNRRVQDPVKSMDDHTLVAISTLAAMEHGRADMRALNMHVSGLKKIVEMRGGLDAIRSTNPMVSNFVFWCAMVSVSEPSLLPLTYGDFEREQDWLRNTDTATLQTHDGGQANLHDFGVDIVTANILHEVQRLSKSYTSTLSYGSPHEAIGVLSALCSALEKMVELSKTQSDYDSPTPGLSQSCRIAGCLHVLTPLSGYFPSPTLLLHSLVRNLKTSLTQTLQATGTRSQLLLWLLSVGGITAHSMPERSWFVGHLVVTIADLRITSWEVMRRHLVQLAFHDNFCDVSFQALWEEVRRKQEALNLVEVDELGEDMEPMVI